MDVHVRLLNCDVSFELASIKNGYGFENMIKTSPPVNIPL